MKIEIKVQRLLIKNVVIILASVLFVVLFIKGELWIPNQIVQAQTAPPALSSYVWNPPPLIATSSASPVLTQKLTSQIENMIQDRNNTGKYDHVGPFVNVIGIGESRGAYFINPAELALTLSQAYPYVPAATQAKIKSFLAVELGNDPPSLRDYYSCNGWVSSGCSADVRREFAPLPTDLFSNICFSSGPDNPTPAGGCAPKANIANLYGLWAYGYYLGQGSYIQTHYPEIQNIYSNFKTNIIQSNAANIKYFPQIGGLIGFARIAQQMGDSANANEAANFAIAALQNASRTGFTTFKTNSYSTITGIDMCWETDPYCFTQHYWTIPLFSYDFQANSSSNLTNIYMTLFPKEIGQFLHDYDLTQVQDYINKVTAWIPAWDMSHPGTMSYGENAYESPLIHWAMFKLHAYTLGDSQSQLMQYLDVPISMGDLYYLQMLTAAIEAPSQSLPPSSPSPTPTLDPPPSPTPSIFASSSPNPCGGADLNNNGKVDLFDYNILVTNFGKTGVGISGGDLNNNGKVDLFDYNILVSNFGKTGC